MGGAKCLTCSVALEPSLRQVVDPVTKESFEIQSCHLCGLGHTLPQPSDLGPYYDPAYHGNRHGLTHRYCIQRRVRFVRRAAPGAANGRRLLDIGCGDGSFLEATRALGWTVFGTELNPTLARQRGLPVEESVAAAGIHGPFDVITSWHSLEHFPNPLRTVREVHALLRPDGRFLAAVPNAEGAHARSFGAKWLHLDVPRHLFHFGPRSLVALLEAARLRPCKFWHQEFEYDFLGFVQSALNHIVPTPNVLFNTLTGKPTGVRAAEQGLNVCLGVLLGVVAVPATLVATLAGAGGTLIVAAGPA